MDKLVSVILPVYGVEKYLPECVDSLLAQTYENLEIILVDDASPDRCGAICDDYAARDSRVRVIHKENGGAASARNAGLDAARGTYVCFVDSDDTVEADYVQTLLETLGDGDMAMCGFYFRSRSGSQPEILAPGIYDREGFLKRFLEDWSCSLLWNKLFRRDCIGSLRMEEGHRVDDEFFTYRVALNCRKTVVTAKCLYHYRMRGSSVMQDDSAVKERMMLDRIAYNVDRCRIVSAEIPALKALYFRHTLDTLTRYWFHSKDMLTAQQKIRQWVRAHTADILRMHGSLGCKMGYFYRLYLCSPVAAGEPNPLQLEIQEYFD